MSPENSENSQDPTNADPQDPGSAGTGSAGTDAQSTENPPVDSVPVYDDKAEIRETIDLSNAVWLRPEDPDSAHGEDAPDPDEEESGTIEIAFVGDYIAMRDSAKPNGPFLIYTQAEWDAFVAGVKDGEFDFEL